MRQFNSRYVLAVAAAVTVLCAGCASTSGTPTTTGATSTPTAVPQSPAQLKAQANKPS